MENTGIHQKQDNREYTVKELFDQLAADSSWEQDDQLRQAIVFGLMMAVQSL